MARKTEKISEEYPIEEEKINDESIINQDESVSIEDEDPKLDKTSAIIEEIPVENEYTSEVKYREVVYLGVADICERIGAVTGNRYTFNKDTYRMPQATHVDEKDYPAIISEKGKGCARKDPSLLFMSKLEWDLEIEQARIANNRL